MTLLVTPKYYDFFSRSLMPIQHYWPVQDDNKCASIKYAVQWGNSHKQSVLSVYQHLHMNAISYLLLNKIDGNEKFLLMDFFSYLLLKINRSNISCVVNRKPQSEL
jgi:hypothetical protein